jgi:hypothetical protein
VSTWNTGTLVTDSCGYIAVDHGVPRQEDDEDSGRPEPPHRPSVIVAFRGTYSITNTIMDLSTIPQEYVPYPAPDDGEDGEPIQPPRCDNCTVHMGFLASWRSARDMVMPQLLAVRQKYPSYPVQLIGHSLGGAVAALAGMELRLSLGWDDVRVTTFGEPMIGNGALARYLELAFELDNSAEPTDDLPYHRVTHANDPVPHLPLAEWGFRPHSGEIYISKPDLQPAPEDVRLCRGARDPGCSAGSGAGDDVDFYSLVGGRDDLDLLRSSFRGDETREELEQRSTLLGWLPVRLKLWQLFFAHRDYFWRLGLCLPGGDPTDWGRPGYNVSSPPAANTLASDL